MAAEENDLTEAQRSGKIQADIHSISGELKEFKSEVKGILASIFEKIAESAPKPMGTPVVVSIIVGLFTLATILFGGIMYVATSQNAPIIAQMNQISRTQQSVSSILQQNINNIQLTNIKLTGVKEQVNSNAQTLDWLLFNENIPKQVTELQKDVEHLKENQMKGKH